MQPLEKSTRLLVCCWWELVWAAGWDSAKPEPDLQTPASSWASGSIGARALRSCPQPHCPPSLAHLRSHSRLSLPHHRGPGHRVLNGLRSLPPAAQGHPSHSWLPRPPPQPTPTPTPMARAWTCRSALRAAAREGRP